jgi:hypothetical protein
VTAIFKILGTPSEDEWGQGHRLFSRMQDEIHEMPMFKK